MKLKIAKTIIESAKERGVECSWLYSFIIDDTAVVFGDFGYTASAAEAERVIEALADLTKRKKACRTDGDLLR